MKNVRLREYRKRDLKFIHELLSDNATKKYFPYMYTTCMEQSNLRLQTRLMDQEYGIADRFVIEDSIIRKPVGEISGRIATDSSNIMELAIIIHPKYRGAEYAKSGVFEFIKYIMKTHPDITKVRMEIADSNLASLSVANKLEFQFVKNRNEKMQYWEKDVK